MTVMTAPWVEGEESRHGSKALKHEQMCSQNRLTRKVKPALAKVFMCSVTWQQQSFKFEAARRGISTTSIPLPPHRLSRSFQWPLIALIGLKVLYNSHDLCTLAAYQ